MLDNSDKKMARKPSLGSIAMFLFLPGLITLLHTVSMRDSGRSGMSPAGADRELSTIQRLDSPTGSITMSWRESCREPEFRYKVVRRMAGAPEGAAVEEILARGEEDGAASCREYIDAPSRPGTYIYEIYEIATGGGERLIGRQELRVKNGIAG